ncbi:MAG: hypothetical protein KAS32_23590 [Candidatus Peribacteraceae bacterium]|nr:hypothetical protein [Candidatus Peribacteraceae bacterium]
MMNKNTEIRAVAAPWHSGVDLLIRSGTAVCTSITMEEVNPHIIVDPSLTIGRNQAQTLIDDLWASGFRPTEGTGSAGSLKATENHLADMRRLVFDRTELVEDETVLSHNG